MSIYVYRGISEDNISRAIESLTNLMAQDAARRNTPERVISLSLRIKVLPTT